MSALRKNTNIDHWLGRVGLGLIFCYCFLASIYFSFFSQIHLSLSFLPFPVFIGEILMFICCILMFILVYRDSESFNQRTMLLLGLYFGWVVAKALINYYYDGPLSFRNAALFYYPIFAVFGYCFYQKARIPREFLMALAFLAAGALLFKVMIAWYWWTYLILFIIALWNTKSIPWRWGGWVFLAGILLIEKVFLYKGPRAHFVSVFFSSLFLASYFGAFLIKRRNFVRLGILLASFLIFISGYLIYSDRNDVSSVTSIQGMIKTYKSFDSQFQKKKVAYVPAKLAVQLYYPKAYSSPFVPVTSLKDLAKCQVRQDRTLDLDQNNIVFRLFVWRDMLHELIQERAWFGFSFGHPQRSRSLEALGWAQSEWMRDGWITPHNSYFHMIYRAGILGIFLIGVLFLMVYRLVRDLFRLDSVNGGLLVSVLVYWLVLSNFFVILEFPYNAIVFWPLFGITLAYRDGLKKQKN